MGASGPDGDCAAWGVAGGTGAWGADGLAGASGVVGVSAAWGADGGTGASGADGGAGASGAGGGAGASGADGVSAVSGADGVTPSGSAATFGDTSAVVSGALPDVRDSGMSGSLARIGRTVLMPCASCRYPVPISSGSGPPASSRPFSGDHGLRAAPS